MHNKIRTLIETNKKKLIAGTLSGAILITLGTTAVFATSEQPNEVGNKHQYEIMSVKADGSEKNMISGIMVKNENGKVQYSTDNGGSWSDTVPEEFKDVINEDGTPKELPGEAGQGLLFKNENGKMGYSEDGGKTWTEGAPVGTNVTTSPDGKDIITSGLPPIGEGGIMVKNENGEIFYSTDGGKTWTDGEPERATVNEDGSGKVTVKLPSLDDASSNDVKSGL